MIKIVPLEDVRIKKGKSHNKRELGAEECTRLIWDHDVWEDEGGRHVHSLLVFWFVPVPLLVFLSIGNDRNSRNS